MFNPEIIFFDWNKTLSYSRFWEQLENKSHPHYKDGQKIFQFLFKDNRSLLRPWMQGKLSTGYILEQIKAGTGLSKDFLQEELVKSCENMKFAFSGLDKLIQNLRKNGIKCVIATDNMDTFRKYTIPGMKLHEIFDDFLISCELGVLKFDIDEEQSKLLFFDTFLSKENKNYNQVALVDDQVDNGFYSSKGFQIFQISSPQELKNFLKKTGSSSPAPALVSISPAK